MDSYSRRMPVYLVLDTSASMVGEPIECVRQGIGALLADLRDDPQAMETVWIGVITFHSRAERVAPLTSLDRFRSPRIEAGGQSALGAALTLLEESLAEDLSRTNGGKRDWRPHVFVMTDGAPSDDWQPVAERIKTRYGDILVACAAGTDADHDLLAKLSPRIVDLSRLRPEDLRSFFQWVTAEIKQGVHGGGG